jgi:hypothetical protein
MTPAARRLIGPGGAAGLAAAALVASLLGGSATARAASAPAREAAAAAMRARVGAAAAGPGADREAVIGAWESAGARLGGARRHLAANARPGALDPASLLFADLCEADLALPRDVPEPGDLLLYREAASAAGARWRVAMLTGSVTAVIVDPRTRRLEEVERGRLLDDLPGPGETRLVAQGTLRACRFSAALLPAGAGAIGPAAAGHRRIALVDAPEAVRQLQWELDHPRDADTGAGHRLTRLVVTPLALVAQGATALLGGAGSLLGRLLDAAGAPAAPLALLWHLLGTSFDGRGLHAVLTDLLLGPALAPLSRLPGAPGLLHPLRAAASFAVSVVTGVDDSDHVLAGGVLLAVACDLFVLAKPLALAGRLGVRALEAGAAPGATLLHRTLDVCGHAGDLVSGRPSAVLRLAGTTPRRRRLGDLLDAASLLVRPASVPGHLAELCGRLARWGRTTTLASTAPPGQRALAAALRHLGAEHLHRIEEAAELSHLHSGGRSLAATAGGTLQPFSSETPPPPIRLPVPERPPRVP